MSLSSSSSSVDPTLSSSVFPPISTSFPLSLLAGAAVACAAPAGQGLGRLGERKADEETVGVTFVDSSTAP